MLFRSYIGHALSPPRRQLRHRLPRRQFVRQVGRAPYLRGQFLRWPQTTHCYLRSGSVGVAALSKPVERRLFYARNPNAHSHAARCQFGGPSYIARTLFGGYGTALISNQSHWWVCDNYLRPKQRSTVAVGGSEVVHLLFLPAQSLTFGKNQPLFIKSL